MKQKRDVILRTAPDGFVLGDIEKEFLLGLIKKLSKVYFAEVLRFCLMGNHFHLLVRMHPGKGHSDEEIKRRFSLCYGDKVEMRDGRIPYLREKWSSLSEYVKEIKQGFSRFYNRRYKRKGFFWSDRFKSVIVDNGETLINCLAYIDLNPVRAGIVSRPESYRWCSVGYHLQRKNREEFLSLDLGLAEFGVKNEKERLAHYRRFLHGKLEAGKGNGAKSKEELEGANASRKGYEIGTVDRFRCRTRYFTDSGIIGSKAFVVRVYEQFKDYFSSKYEKKPKTIKGLEGLYSLKRLSEAI